MATSQAVTWALATASAVIVPRFIGPSDVGKWRVATSVWGIVGVVVTFGTTLQIQRAIARNQREGLALINPVLLIRTVAFGVASAIMLPAALLVGSTGQTLLIGALVGVPVLVGLWSEVYLAAFVGLERMATNSAVNVFTRATQLLLTIAALWAGTGMIGVLVVTLIGAVAGLALVLRQFLRLDVPRPRPRWRDSWTVLLASMPLMVVMLAQTTYRQLDVLVIARLAGSRDVGWYGAADVLVGSLFFPTTVVMSTVFPTLGRTYAQDRAAFEQLIRRTFSLLLLLSTPVGFGAMVVAPAFSTLLLGDEFAGSGSVVSIMSIVTMFTFGATLFAYAAAAAGRELFVGVLLFAMAALTIPLDLLFVPWASDRWDNGAIGGALSYVVTEAIQFVVGLVVIAPFLISRSVAWRSARVLLAGGLMALAVWPLRDVFVIVPAAVGAVVYALAILALRALDGDQREMLSGALARLRRAAPGGPETPADGDPGSSTDGPPGPG